MRSRCIVTVATTVGIHFGTIPPGSTRPSRVYGCANWRPCAGSGIELPGDCGGLCRLWGGDQQDESLAGCPGTGWATPAGPPVETGAGVGTGSDLCARVGADAPVLVAVGYVDECDPLAMRRWLAPLVKRLGVSLIVTVEPIIALRNNSNLGSLRPVGEVKALRSLIEFKHRVDYLFKCVIVTLEDC